MRHARECKGVVIAPCVGSATAAGPECSARSAPWRRDAADQSGIRRRTQTGNAIAADRQTLAASCRRAEGQIRALHAAIGTAFAELSRRNLTRGPAMANNSLFGIHGAALEVRCQRMGMLASNIANASTPGFKARDIDFQRALARSRRRAARRRQRDRRARRCIACRSSRASTATPSSCRPSRPPSPRMPSRIRRRCRS